MNERRYLLREQKPGDAWFSYLIYALMLGVAVLWAWAFVLASARIGTGRRDEPVQNTQEPATVS